MELKCWEAAEDAVAACAEDNLSASLLDTQRYKEAKSFLLEQLPEAERALGVDDDTSILLRANYAMSLYLDGGASRDDVVKAVALLEALLATTQRIYGPSHPKPAKVQIKVGNAREKLALFPLDGEPTCAAIGLEDGDQLEAENAQDAVSAPEE